MNETEKLNLKCLKYLVAQTNPNNSLFVEIRKELLDLLQEALSPQSGEMNYGADVTHPKGCGKGFTKDGEEEPKDVVYPHQVCGNHGYICPKCSLKSESRSGEKK